MMKSIRNILATAVAFAISTSGALALTITSSTATFSTGNGAAPSSINPGGATIQYFANGAFSYDDGGAFDASYDITWSDAIGIFFPQDATITYVNPPALTLDPIYLLVAGSSTNPDWKVYDLSAWNGTETISINNPFGPNKAIDYLKIYMGNQTTTTGVPDGGTTALMLGSILLGMGMIARRKSS